jgi:hypothetical protein
MDDGRHASNFPGWVPIGRLKRQALFTALRTLSGWSQRSATGALALGFGLDSELGIDRAHDVISDPIGLILERIIDWADNELRLNDSVAPHERLWRARSVRRKYSVRTVVPAAP